VRRRIPETDITTVDPVGVAAVDLEAGDPLLGNMVTEVAVPTGWNVIEAPVPDHAVPGAAATAGDPRRRIGPDRVPGSGREVVGK
jgi:hypothetical protein